MILNIINVNGKTTRETLSMIETSLMTGNWTLNVFRAAAKGTREVVSRRVDWAVRCPRIGISSFLIFFLSHTFTLLRGGHFCESLRSHEKSSLRKKFTLSIVIQAEFYGVLGGLTLGYRIQNLILSYLPNWWNWKKETIKSWVSTTQESQFHRSTPLIIPTANWIAPISPLRVTDRVT